MSEAPSVFISHSCRDRQTGPEGDEERWRRLQFARAVRARIVAGLEARGVAVLWDQSLKAGDHWRAELHAWLGLCDAAVVLLDVDSARSEWVLKEATILSWRSQLGSRVRLLPVLLPGFTPAQLDEFGLGPLQLGELQVVMAGDEAEAVGDRVVAVLEGLQLDDGDSELRTWAEDVEQRLKRVDPLYLGRAADELGVSREQLADFTDAARTLAHHLLHVDYGRLLRALRELKRGMQREDVARFVNLVLPGWVSEGAARHLREIVEAPGTALLGVADANSGGDFVQRAYCCQLDDSQLVPFADAIGEDPGDAVRGLERAVCERLNLGEDGVEAFLEHPPSDDWPYFALVGPQAVREDVVRALQARFDATLRLVLLGGPVATEAAEAWGLTLVRPALAPEEAKRWRVQRGMVGAVAGA